MGTVPSRESIERGLWQMPDYGEKHKIVMIPLTKKFFPSPNCLLLRQLLGAREDPFVHYYHTFDEGLVQGLLTSDTAGVDTATTCGTENREDIACDRGDVTQPSEEFEPLKCTPEQFFEAYVGRTERLQIFDTDKQMFESYKRDPKSVRPLPCAVAFICGSATASCGPTGCEGFVKSGGLRSQTCDGSSGRVPSEEDGEVEAGGVGGSGKDGGTQSPNPLEDPVVLLGLRLRVVGFIGDTSGIASCGCDSVVGKGAFRLQVFLNKSVGDHNFAHTFISAAYTYVAQWRDALSRETGVKGEAQAVKDQPSGLREDSLMLPPVETVVITSRRANVPMLCFLRVLRASLLRLSAVAEADSVVDANGSFCNQCGSRNDHVFRTIRGIVGQVEVDQREDPNRLEGRARSHGSDATVELTDVLRMWLVNDILYACISRNVVRCAIGCIARRLSCQDCIADVVWPRYVEVQATGDSQMLSMQMSGCSIIPKAVTTPFPPRGDLSTGTMHCEATALVVQAPSNSSEVGHDVCSVTSLLPNQQPRGGPSRTVVVEEWPADGVDLVALVDGKDANVNRCLHLYWVLGHSAEVRRTAIAALAAWKASGGVMRKGTSRNLKSRNAWVCCDSTEGTGEEYVEAGELLYLGVDSNQQNGTPRWVVTCTGFALEELLLSELHNSCKMAREAHIRAENWVRYSDSGAQRQRPDPLLLPPEVVGGDGKEASDFINDVRQLVGDGSLCLWRSTLCTGVKRVVAVTPYFLRPPRKKRSRRRLHRRPRVSLRGSDSLMKVSGPFVAGANEHETRALQSKDEKIVIHRAATAEFPRAASAGAEPVVTAQNAERSVPLLLKSCGSYVGDVEHPTSPFTIPLVGFGCTPPMLSQGGSDGNAASTSREEPAWSLGHQCALPRFTRPAFDNSQSIAPDMDLFCRASCPSVSLWSRQTPREDQPSSTVHDRWGASLPVSSSWASQCTSFATFSNRLENSLSVCGATSEELSGLLQRSSVVGGLPVFLHQRVDTGESLTSLCTVVGEDVQLSSLLCGSLGTTVSSDDAKAPPSGVISVNREHKGDAITSSSLPRATPITVWVRHGLKQRKQTDLMWHGHDLEAATDETKSP